MKLVLLTHPDSFATQSMPRFAGMIQRGMEARGHQVQMWTSPSRLSRLRPPSAFLCKWLGYADQFVLFPRELHRRIAAQPGDTVFVVTDHALGMWVPYLAHRPHVIHCHDFLALRSALGEFPENPTGWTGKQYQRLIQKGFSKGRVFLSDSRKTRIDLHRFVAHPTFSETIYIGLNHPFRAMDPFEAGALLKASGILIPKKGYLLHVGGNQWYKNRRGVLEIYRQIVMALAEPPELWLAGPKPNEQIVALAASIPAPGNVRFLSGLSNEQVNAAYSQALALLFPSLEEGFGWPIAEAMASNCPVITTDATPMTEVAGNAARLIPRMPNQSIEVPVWAQRSAGVVAEVLQMSREQRAEMVQRGRQNANRFDAEKALAAYESIYKKVLATDGQR